jgi:hypothetical protein
VAAIAANEYHLALPMRGLGMLDWALRGTVIAVLLAAGTAGAQNLVPAPDFDTANEFTTNWGNLGADKTWSSLDFEDSPFSGSASVDNTTPSAGTGTLINSTCFPVLEGDRIAYSAWQFTPSPPQGDGFARITLQWRASCPSGAFVGGDVSTISAAVGDWTYFSSEAIAPVGAGGARLSLSSVKTSAGGSYKVYFDHVYAPEPSALASTCAAALCLASAATARRVRRANARDGARVALRPAR